MLTLFLCKSLDVLVAAMTQWSTVRDQPAHHPLLAKQPSEVGTFPQHRVESIPRVHAGLEVLAILWWWMLQIKSATYQHESVNFRLFLPHAMQREEWRKSCPLHSDATLKMVNRTERDWLIDLGVSSMSVAICKYFIGSNGRTRLPLV